METGSLVRASERLHISQSTVTARLKALENELGQSLLQRNKSGIQLTAAGYKFKRYAGVMLDLWRQARQETSLPDSVEIVCNLGCHIDLWPLVGRRALQEIRHRFPAAAFSAWQGQGAQLEQWLKSGLVDVALTYRMNTAEEQAAIRLFEERLVLVSDQDDSPMRFDPDYIFVEAGEEFGRDHAAAYSDAGTAKYSFGCAVWALEHLLDVGGSAYLPEPLVKDYLDQGRLFPVKEAPCFRRVAYLRSGQSSGQSWAWLADLISDIMANPSDKES